MGYINKEARINILKDRIIKQISICFFYLLVFLSVIQLQSCNESKPHEFITEGEIIYNIEYPESNNGNAILAFLPTEMNTYFKLNASRTLIEGPFGTFKLTYILNYPKKINYTLLQVLDKKYVYKSDMDDLAYGYNQMKKVKINYSGLEKKIAGYRCKHASVVFEGERSDTVQVFYTNEIGLMHPNYNNPFREIEGVLMEFSINLDDIKMNLRAKKVQKRKIEDNFFKLPDGFVSISEAQMKRIIGEYNKTNEQ